MAGCIHEELLVAHEQLVDNEDNSIANGSIGIGDFGTSSTLCADGGKEPPAIVKIGDTKAVDLKGVVSDMAHLVANGTDVTVVHDGSTTADETLEELGEESICVGSPLGVSGYSTDERAMEVFPMVIPGKLNTGLATLSREADVDALGFSGVSDGLLTGPYKSAVHVVKDGKKRIKRGGHSGKTTSVNATLLETLFDGGYTPIVTVLMLVDDGMPINTDTDHAAATVAGAPGAKLVVLTDVKGVYADPDDESTLIETADIPEEFSMLGSTTKGFMTKKVMATREAFDGRVAEVVVADTSPNDPIVVALNDGGTHVTPDALVEAEGAEQ